jgi:hypothetical protein
VREGSGSAVVSCGQGASGAVVVLGLVGAGRMGPADRPGHYSHCERQ